MKGYEELLRRVEPERILCYHEPFPEMRGNIVPIDYELSSWRHMEAEEGRGQAVFGAAGGDKNYLCKRI